MWRERRWLIVVPKYWELKIQALELRVLVDCYLERVIPAYPMSGRARRGCLSQAPESMASAAETIGVIVSRNSHLRLQYPIHAPMLRPAAAAASLCIASFVRSASCVGIEIDPFSARRRRRWPILHLWQRGTQPP